MASLYLASTEPFIGKSVLCAALLDRFRRDGYRVGYMKPISVSPTPQESGAVDEDAQRMRSLFNLLEPAEQLAPVLVTTRVIEGVLNGSAPDFSAELVAAYAAIGREKDVVLLEGANSWTEGSLLDLSSVEVCALLDSPLLLLARYRSPLAADAVLAVKHALGDRMVGVVLNQVPQEQIEYVKANLVPFLERRGIPVLGILPDDVRLAAVTVRDLTEHLGLEAINGDPGRLVENLSVGAMGADAALRFFRRKPNKAVITGGDRVDLQIAALETSTACLILTGNMRPAASVLARAEQEKVAILVTSQDTLTVVQRAESLLGHVRFGQGDQQERFSELAASGIDQDRLRRLLKLGPPAADTQG